MQIKNRKDAIEKAKEIMRRADQLMRLEGQEVACPKDRKWLFDRLVNRILTKGKL